MECDINSLSKKELQDIVHALYKRDKKCEEYIEACMRKSCGGKYRVTPYDIASLHKQGYGLADIVNILNNEYKKKNILDSNGNVLCISIQVVRQKLSKYERETGEQVYSTAKKGRKKGTKNGESYRDNNIRTL